MDTKIGRYVIENNAGDDELLQDMSWLLKEKNIVTVRWVWPSNILIKMAVVLDLKPGDNRDLEALLHDGEPFAVITREMDKQFSRDAADGGMAYKVFPAKFGEGNDIIIINQTKNNVTDIIYKKTKVLYKVTYSNIMFTRYKKARIEISGTGKNAYQDALFYMVGRSSFRYPLDSGVLYIAQNEEIVVEVLEVYKNKIELQSI